MKRLVLIFLTALFTVGMVGCNKAETAPEANTDQMPGIHGSVHYSENENWEMELVRMVKKLK